MRLGKALRRRSIDPPPEGGVCAARRGGRALPNVVADEQPEDAFHAQHAATCADAAAVEDLPDEHDPDAPRRATR